MRSILEARGIHRRAATGPLLDRRLRNGVDRNASMRIIAHVLLLLLTTLVEPMPSWAGSGPDGLPIAPLTPLPDWPDPAVELYVAPDGTDTAPGTREAPFATLERARDALRQLRQDGKLAPGGAAVIVRGGEHRIQKTFTLAATDSGDASSPIRYLAADGERPVFTGGIRLEGFEPVRDEAVLTRLPEEARDKVMQLDLTRFGVSDLPPLRLGGFDSGLGFKTHPVMELFFDGKAMPISRWPNEGFARIADVSVKDGHSMHGRTGSKTGRFTYEGDRPARWTEERAVLLYGYWFFDWADSYERVASINVEQREFVLDPPYCNYGYRPGAPYYALNLLSEIDQPGEWYLDRATRLLYFYPPSDPAQARVELSRNDFPFVELDAVSHTTFQGFVWELGGADAVVIRDGEHCTVAASIVRRCGGQWHRRGGG